MRNFTRSRTAFIVYGILFSLLLAGSAFAQSGRSTVRGTVKDQQGNVVAGATVSLINEGKNFSRTQTTNEDGSYTFSAVPPDTYRVEVESGGFKRVSVAGVAALVDTPVDVDVQLEAGLATETVTVTAATEAPLNTSDATLGTAFESRRISELPLNARNVVGLLSLQTGVTPGGYVSGARADQTNITLDGIDNNEQQRGLDVVTDEAFAGVLRVTPDSLQEFRVTTTNPNADQGRSSGAQVSLVTKSGTNNFHGSLYEFHRNTVTTANDFFNNAAGRYTANDFAVQTGAARAGDPRAPRPQLLRNVFGGSLGGPIKKDRAFFFFTYEGFREASETPVEREVPLPTLGQGIVRYRTESGASDPTCPAGTPAGVRCLTSAQIGSFYNAVNGVDPGRNPVALAALADAARRYPANTATLGDGLNTGGFRFNARTPSNLNVYIAKFDFNLTDRQTLFARGTYQNDVITQVSAFPDTVSPKLWNHPKGFSAGHTWTATNNIVNRFSYGLTRAAFTDGGDLAQNDIFFRFIYSPTLGTRTLSRTTPVHNFVNDFSWIKGSHTMQYGGNVRLISNNRTSFGNSFDNAIVNPSFFDFSGASLYLDTNGEFDSIFPDVSGDFETDFRDALAAVIGRFSQYQANLNYGKNGQLLAAGTGIERTFATQEYELYAQDSWRVRPNLTLSFGLRWGTSTPVYETNGVQVAPVQSLGEYFRRRVAGAEAGSPVNDPITVDLAGKANDRRGYYEQDWNNFAPSVAFAWSPDFGDNFFGRLIGRNGRSVVRGGFRKVYDRIGSQLAVTFDLNSSLGFKSSQTISANTFDVSNNLGPLLTGFNQNVRALPGLTITPSISFPLVTPSDEQQRIESSLDDTLTTPSSYSVNLSYGREVGRGLSFEASYVGRFARDLLATRDIMHLNNLKDPKSGQTWYEAANLLADARYRGVNVSQMTPIPFFENVLPGLARPDLGQTATQRAYRRVAFPSRGGQNITDYTFLQLLWDDGLSPLGDNLFFHPQYAAFSAFGTIAKSNYNSGQFSIRQRFKSDLAFDFNYTLSHSLDNASGLQSAGTFDSSAFIVNPLNPDMNYANSDFDIRHIVNANWLVGLPIGRGRAFLGDIGGVAETILGGWQMSGIARWNSGLPVGEPFQADRWATNWNVQSNMVRVADVRTSPVRGPEPNLFSDPTAAFRGFREPRAGETGDRNILRYPGYVTVDIGLSKNFKMPWEGHSLQFRTEVFNLTNTQRLTGAIGFGLPVDPFLPSDPFSSDPAARQPQRPSSDFGKLTATQTPLNENKAGRVIQFALRYTF
jgi:hypothetical protein